MNDTKVTIKMVKEIYHKPLTTLIFEAQKIHHRYHDPSGVQLCTLKSIKTG